ncbi:MAG: hypothetical protein OSJ36_02360 [Odoribacter sp.]|nr:hypothetical protein [Odoribacter sp.]
MIIDNNNFNIGKIKGKAGGCTVYKRLGKTCVRSCPDSRKLTSAGQVAQQHRIASVAILYKAVRAAGLDVCWKAADKPAGWTGYNLFVTKNLPAFAPDGFIGDAGKVRLTVGTGIYLPDEIAIRQAGENTWALSWKNTTCYPGCHAEDRVVLAFMRGGKYFAIKILNEFGIACRKDGCAEFKLPTEWLGYSNVYCFMRSKTGAVSDSKHFLL